MLKSRVRETLGIEVPIVLAPMGRWAEASLATAVCQAGGLGTFGAYPHRGLTVPEVHDQVARIRQQTDRPFGAGFLTPFLVEHRPNFDAVLEAQVPVVLLSFGDPSAWIPIVHDAGSKVICQVQTFDLARKAVEAGADVLCVQGNAAGGHTGRENLLPFLIQVLEAFPETPTIASGAISSGRALAAVLAAGAEGAWVGTALVATEEAAFTKPEYRQAILDSDGRDTIHSATTDIVWAHGWSRPDWPAGVAMRHRRNEITDRWHGHEDELAKDSQAKDRYFERLSDEDPAVDPLFYGQGAGSINQVKTVQETIESLVSDALTCLREAAH